MLIAELISVGTELLMGEIVDSNAAYLAQELKQRGVFVQWKTTVGDNLGRIGEALERALSRSDLVILGGGLGPTDDDLTREAILYTIGEEAVVDQNYLAKLRSWFESRGRSFPEANTKQAWVSPSSEALPNPVGTAPGWFVRVPTQKFSGHKIVVAMPGPPREMKPMFHDQVLPRLSLPQNGFYFKTLRTVGIGESHLAEKLGDMTKTQNPSIGTYARRDGVHVRVAASAATLTEAQALAKPIQDAVSYALEGFVYGHDETTLPEVVVAQLLQEGQTLGVCEWLTGGLVLDELSNQKNAARVLRGGLVALGEQTLLQFGANAQTFVQHGTVSEEAALEMARLARAVTGAGIGLGVVGTPDAQAGMPAGALFVAIHPSFASPIVRQFVVAGDARTLKERAAFVALGALWKALPALKVPTESTP